MNKEIKKLSAGWKMKFDAPPDGSYACWQLLQTDRLLQECEEILSEVNLGTGFVSKKEGLERLLEERELLWNYAHSMLST